MASLASTCVVVSYCEFLDEYRARPVLPDDLASDIQMFVQTEFARQYFTTHRTGFIFRRKIPVEVLMTWQKSPITAPLLVLNRVLHKDAVKMFKVIQRIMGDRDRDRPIGVRTQTSSSDHPPSSLAMASAMNASSTSLPSMVNNLLEEERWLLTEGLTHGELRDEIYCQLVKQLTGNANPESLFRGWQLLCVLLVTFPPSKNFEHYLRSFIQQHIVQTEGRVDIMAKYCLQRLSIIARKGPRGKPPTTGEIATASDAAFNPSTFGESLDAVIRLQERTYSHLQIPIILPFLADGILALGGTKSEGIFRIPGDGDSVSELKIRIEQGFYNLEGVDDPHVPASLLKLWLRELADPLVPTELYNDCVACAKEPEACVAMVARLPTINRRVVLFVISFLQLFLEEKIMGVTKMTAANLALVMAPNLLRCDSESMTVVFTNAPYEQMFVHNLLLHLKCGKVDPGYVPKHGLGSAVAPSLPRNSMARARRQVR
ncbi:Rho GTPase activation protein [Schizopora paradoxa]|uniref:Rho GTPase activation protein n=1 Tax=Schizopora paradoxa TaxID=27342 RepID=A0A0H2R682_9AGAM|nr:Rho GTPase activation protein [Schizopora paradoxa]